MSSPHRRYWHFVPVFVILALASCCSQKGPSKNAAIEPQPIAVAAPAAKIRIATFNIQNFGPTKAGKPEIMQVLASIIRKYDVVAVQEVSDVSGQAPRKLLAAVNADGSAYGLLLSERTGQQPDDHSSQEQYAFYYNTKTIGARDNGMLYPDGEHDYFQREPFVAGFAAKQGSLRLVLITIHTMPERAVSEIASLKEVIAWARTRYAGEDDFIALGDYNAGGSYVSAAQLDHLRTHDLPYLWIVPDSSDSNVSEASACPYDRIVSTEGLAANYTGSWGVDRAFKDKSISDHWPVWAEFSNKTTSR
jgi:endonuclease/exonuclease/phosphatase family metal-dependent hydrolase